MGQGEPAPSRLRWLRWLRRLIAALLLLAVALTVVALPLTVFPETVAAPDDVDALILFAGGQGERLQLARRLMDDGAAPVLALSSGEAPEWAQANRLCAAEDLAYEVLCFEPTPSSTRGEARASARLAEEHGWHRLAVVTSRYHATRAGMLLRRCSAAEVEVVAADPDLEAREAVVRSAVELLALARDGLIRRDC